LRFLRLASQSRVSFPDKSNSPQISSTRKRRAGWAEDTKTIPNVWPATLK
jgi:hypothetical protein